MKKNERLTEIFLRILGTIGFIAILSFIYFVLFPPLPEDNRPLFEYQSIRTEEAASSSTLYYANQQQSLVEAVEFFEDPFGLYDFETIHSHPEIDFYPMEEGSSSRNFSFNTQTVWVRFTIKQFYSQEKYLFFVPLAGNIVDFWAPDSEGGWHKDHYSIAVENKILPQDKNIYMEFPRIYTPNQTFYLKMTSRPNKRVRLRPEILTYQTYASIINQRNISDAIYLGFMLMVVLYHLFLYSSVKERYYLFYALFIFFGMIFRLNNMDFLVWRIFQDNFYAQNALTASCHILSMSFGILFFRVSLSQSKTPSAFIKSLNGLTNIIILVMVLMGIFIGLAMPIYTIYSLLISLISLFGITAALMYTFNGIGNRNPTAFWYLVGFTPIILFAILEIFNYEAFTLLREHYPFIDPIAYGDIFQSLVFTIALGRAINTLVIRKTSDLKRSSELARKLQKEAENANAMKSNFLANISHELRTPLSAISGFAELLENGKNSDRVFYSHKIQKESEHLLKIINDLLDLTKVETGKLNLEEITFLSRDLFKEIISTMEHRIQEKGLELVTQFDERIPEYLSGDPLRFKQVMINLIQNAYKFTPKGFISVTIFPVQSNDETVFLRAEVADSGIGISHKKHQKIFESFEQADSSITRLYGGTGLGTSISKKMVHLMGGEIGLSSKEGVGTQFWIEIPFVIGKSENYQEKTFNAEALTPGRARILFVDDYPTNREIAQIQIENLGYEAVIASDGAEALDLLNEDTFDLILMDIQMPVLDGLSAISMLRKSKGPNQNTPAIAVTAGGFHDHETEFKSRGFQDFYSKPLKKDDIIRALNTYVFPSDAINKRKDRKGQETAQMKFTPPIEMVLFQQDFPNRQTARIVLDSYLGTARFQLKKIKEALEKTQMSIVLDEIRSLKSGAAGIYADKLVEIIESFNMQLTSEPEPIQLRKELDHIIRELEEIENFIRNQYGKKP